MTSENEKLIETGRIQDFDAVSLYPSAMFTMRGIPKGVPKVLSSDPDERREQINRADQIFIEIDIKDIRQKYKFGLIPHQINGIKQYGNDTGIVYVDKTGLEDLIEFCGIEYEILRGYYFDEGVNIKINEFIKKLFDLRLKYKTAHNPLQNTIKLLLNSIYGKSIMKNIPTDLVVINKEDLPKYTIRYYNYIDSVEIPAVGNKVFMKRIKSVDRHFNVPQFGCAVLSQSKHLMNRVICLAEQNDIDIFYTDTDSIHIREECITRLSDLYRDKFNKELIGSNLTQFHTDFEPVNGKPSHSTCLIALGKKSYLDQLENDDGVKAWHIRMKGIPNNVIMNYCAKNKIDVDELYLRLYDGESVTFDLTDGATCFKMTKGFDQVSLERFKRTVKF
jgi:hypothetical protein